MVEVVGDEAWEAVVALEERSGQRLYGYALRLGIDSGRAGDLVQEALIRLCRELRKGTVIESREAWAYRTISRLAIDDRRSYRRLVGVLARLGDRVTPRVVEIDATERLAVWSQVDRLPARQRQAVYLRYQADLRFAEVASVMGITEGAARSLTSQAIATLRSRLTIDEDA